MEVTTDKSAVEQGFSRWAKSRGFKRRKLTANRAVQAGVQVVALESSNFGPDYYVRYGICLRGDAAFVREPECDIRIPVEGPWGAQPAIRLEEAPTADDVGALLEQYVDPLLAATETRQGLDELHGDGALRSALILRSARQELGWPDE